MRVEVANNERIGKAAKTVELPSDIERLNRLVIEQRALLWSRKVEIDKLKIEVGQLKAAVRSIE